MTASISINLGKVPLIGGRITAGAKAGIEAAALVVKGQAQLYPKVRVRKVDTDLWTVKQRRYFFAALRDGTIEVPYRRGLASKSERLKQRWTSKVASNGLSATVGNNASYAKVMYEKKSQSWYHKGNWDTTEQIAKKAAPDARKAFLRGIATELDK